MIHVDIKQLVWFERVGYRITCDPLKGSSLGAGDEKEHVAVEDATHCRTSRPGPIRGWSDQGGLLQPGGGMVQQPGVLLPTGSQQQRPSLQVPWLAKSL